MRQYVEFDIEPHMFRLHLFDIPRQYPNIHPEHYKRLCNLIQEYDELIQEIVKDNE